MMTRTKVSPVEELRQRLAQHSGLSPVEPRDRLQQVREDQEHFTRVMNDPAAWTFAGGLRSILP